MKTLKFRLKTEHEKFMLDFCIIQLIFWSASNIALEFVSLSQLLISFFCLSPWSESFFLHKVVGLLEEVSHLLNEKSLIDSARV